MLQMPQIRFMMHHNVLENDSGRTGRGKGDYPTHKLVKSGHRCGKHSVKLNEQRMTSATWIGNRGVRVCRMGD